MLGTSIGFIALLDVPALDFLFGWSAMPLGGVVVGDVLVVIGFSLIALSREHICVGNHRSERPAVCRELRPESN